MDTESLVLEALENVGIGTYYEFNACRTIGRNEQEGFALARTLILKPKVILYDEPTSGLDPITSKEIIELMRSITKEIRHFLPNYYP